MRRAPVRVTLLIGVALILAPVVFSMFSRAPGGATMLKQFHPYMNTTVLDRFQGWLDTVNGSDHELVTEQEGLAAARLHLSPAQFDQSYASLTSFEHAWPVAYRQMSSLVGSIKGNIGNYDAVRALPPFTLFPYFFVAPGVFLVGLSALLLRRARRNRPVRGLRRALAALGLALVAAPFVFQMFSRAPAGQHMLTAFKPIMTTSRVTSVQEYFLDIAGGEGAIRTQLLPALEHAGVTPAQVQQLLPRTEAFERIWTPMENQMAPMLAAMSNNLGRFQGLLALPPFGLFPYFFVIPGVLVFALALLAGRPRREPPSAAASTARPQPSPAHTGKEH